MIHAALGEMTQNNDHFAVQGRSLPIESPYGVSDFILVNNTNLIYFAQFPRYHGVFVTIAFCQSDFNKDLSIHLSIYLSICWSEFRCR